MAAILPLALVAAALFAALVTPAATPILGLDHSQFARAATGAAIGLWLILFGIRRAGPSAIARAVGGALFWASAMVVLTGVYTYRFELADVADRMLAELSPEPAQIGGGGEVIVKRRLGGEFVIPARVNEANVAFLFDTGASSVVLRAEDAAKAGVKTAALSYDVDVTTANGAAMAAEARVERIEVGPIALRNVRVLVAKPGALNESLLGMTFLERLKSYTVEGGRLILRGK